MFGLYFAHILNLHVKDCDIDKKNVNKPISWIVAYKYGALGILQTVPEWRGEGCAKACINNLACHLESLGVTPHTHIEDGNTSSLALFEKMGFIKTHNARWVRSIGKNTQLPPNTNFTKVLENKNKK